MLNPCSRTLLRYLPQREPVTRDQGVSSHILGHGYPPPSRTRTGCPSFPSPTPARNRTGYPSHPPLPPGQDQDQWYPLLPLSSLPLYPLPVPPLLPPQTGHAMDRIRHRLYTSFIFTQESFRVYSSGLIRVTPKCFRIQWYILALSSGGALAIAKR